MSKKVGSILIIMIFLLASIGIVMAEGIGSNKAGSKANTLHLKPHTLNPAPYTLNLLPLINN